MIYDLARPFLFALEPEPAHDLALANLKRAHGLGLARLLRPHLADDPVQIMGLRFRNPVGLAAGMDKNGDYIDALAEFGFGFVEAGTVTPRAQPGNERPRMFRLPAANALINRLGFNNFGLDHFIAALASNREFAARGGVLGANIGKNAATPIARAADDYCAGLRALYPLLATRPAYVTVNISSPNTNELRALQGDAELRPLLQALLVERERLAEQHGARLPMAVKIAPDLADDDLRRVADTLVEFGIDAVIATNTTIDRTAIVGLPHAREAGGLSGAPLMARATDVVRVLARHLAGVLPIIGVGGILCGADAAAKLAAGASLVQMYTGLIYRGPGLVAECRRDILRWRARPQP